MTKPRHVELAQQQAPTEQDRDLMNVASLIDPDSWRCPKLPYSYTRRLRSLEAAERVIAQQDAARAALLPEPEPRVSGWWDRLAERMFPKAARAA